MLEEELPVGAVEEETKPVLLRVTRGRRIPRQSIARVAVEGVWPAETKNESASDWLLTPANVGNQSERGLIHLAQDRDDPAGLCFTKEGLPPALTEVAELEEDFPVMKAPCLSAGIPCGSEEVKECADETAFPVGRATTAKSDENGARLLVERKTMMAAERTKKFFSFFGARRE